MPSIDNVANKRLLIQIHVTLVTLVLLVLFSQGERKILRSASHGAVDKADWTPVGYHRGPLPTFQCFGDFDWPRSCFVTWQGDDEEEEESRSFFAWPSQAALKQSVSQLLLGQRGSFASWHCASRYELFSIRNGGSNPAGAVDILFHSGSLVP